MSSSVISSEKSTTGRAMSSEPLRRALFGAFPRSSERLLARRFLTPWRRAAPLDGRDARFSRTVSIGGAEIRVHVWGQGPLLILCHGWAGGAVQLSALRSSLLDAGFSVAAFDAPGHGAQRQQTSNAGLFTRAIEAVARELSPVHGIVGHSLGGMAAALASARSVGAQALVLLAPMPSFDFALDQFQAAVGFPDALRERIALRVEGTARVLRRDARLDRLLQDATPTLLVHDASDSRIPVHTSRELARAFAHVEYLETTGLGHRRLLDEPSVSARVVAFLTAHPPAGILPLERALSSLPEFRF